MTERYAILGPILAGALAHAVEVEVMGLSSDSQTSEAAESATDPMLQRIVEALEEIRAAEFDYEILASAADVLDDQSVLANWRPSLSYLAPERIGDEYHVTIYTAGACNTCPVKKSHVGTIQPKLRELVGSDRVFVHDYFEE